MKPIEHNDIWPIGMPKEMEYKRIIYKPGKVTQIIMNKPRYHNAISAPMFLELEHAFDRAAVDPECRVIVLSGAGRSFCSGHDAMGGGSPEAAWLASDEIPVEEKVKQVGMKRVQFEYNWEHHYYAWRFRRTKWHRIPKPTIAMVHGYCIFGGMDCIQNMDLIFASEDALFLRGGGEEGLFDLLPRKTYELWYEHRFMTAREAHEMGLVSRIYPTPEVLEEETLAYANRVADNPRATGIRLFKEAVLGMMDIKGFETMGLYAEWHGWGAGRWLVPTERRIAARGGRNTKGMADSVRAKANLSLKLEADQKYYGKEPPPPMKERIVVP